MNLIEANSNDHQKFSRYEFKYILSNLNADLIENEIKTFMYPDIFSKKNKDLSYPVRSLYFENDLNECFHEKNDGLKSRVKFRIRTYSFKESEINSSNVFFELKGKYNERTYKNRIKIKNLNHLELFNNYNKIFELCKLYKNDEIIQKFVHQSFRKKIRPKVIIDYIRKPYISDFDSNFRITFDKNLRASPMRSLTFKRKKFEEVLSGYTIIEIKFNRRIPMWFHRIIQVNQLKKKSVSKFVEGLKTLKLAIEI